MTAPVTPPRSERTPQRIGGLLKKTRIARVAAQVVAANDHTWSALNGKAGPTNLDAMEFCESQIPMPYAITGCRCDPNPCRARDCSGIIYGGVNYAFRKHDIPSNLCGSSFGLAALGRDWGTEISEEEYLVTPFALGIRCPFCNPNFNGSNGHVVASRGDGKQTAECGGKQTGCYHGWATGRGFTFFMRYPGLAYVDRNATVGDIDMFVQVSHYNPRGEPTGPTKPPTGHEDESSVIVVSDDGASIEARYGASIASDQPVDATKPMLLRRWYPPRVLPAGHRFTGVAFRSPTAADPVPGGVATVSDGTTRKFRLS